jgi:hypothetical protein
MFSYNIHDISLKLIMLVLGLLLLSLFELIYSIIEFNEV